MEETLAILPAGDFSHEGHKDTMTDKEAKKFYNSTLWKHKRMQILERDHYECQDCRKRVRNAVAAVVAWRCSRILGKKVQDRR